MRVCADEGLGGRVAGSGGSEGITSKKVVNASDSLEDGPEERWDFLSELGLAMSGAPN